MKKTLIITEWAPPMNEGSPIMINNLFRYFPKGSYCVLMDTLKGNIRRVDPNYWLNCPYYFFNLPLFCGGNRLIGIYYTFLEFLLLPFLVLKGARVVKKEKIDNILAPTNNRGFFLSAYFVHKITKIPLFLLMFDLFEEVQLSRIKIPFCRWIERKMFKTASKVFVTTEKMGEYYRKKYNIDPEVIPHSVENPSTYAVRKSELRRVYNIVYTGSIYGSQYDCIVRLINAVNSLPNINLYLYTTPRQGDLLAKNAKITKKIIISYADRKDVAEIQRNADVLFLPYTFNASYIYKLVVENQAPGKIAEYLVSGVPILLHAPAYSYLHQYNRKNDYAYSVTEPSEEALAEGILRLLKDRELREKIVKNAFMTAKLHDSKVISERLKNCLLE